VQITVYYDLQHPWNVARIKNACAPARLLSGEFRPLSVPSGAGAGVPRTTRRLRPSYANTIAWSEGIFFIAIAAMRAASTW